MYVGTNFRNFQSSYLSTFGVFRRCSLGKAMGEFQPTGPLTPLEYCLGKYTFSDMLSSSHSLFPVVPELLLELVNRNCLVPQMGPLS